MTGLTDTHCHIHDAAGTDDVAARWHKSGITDPLPLVQSAHDAGVTRLICVGCTLADSKLAVAFARTQPRVWASIGLHPHEAKHYVGHDDLLAEFAALLDDAGSTGAALLQSGVAAGGAAPCRARHQRARHGADRPPGPPTSVSDNSKIVAIGECGLDYFYTHSPKKEQTALLRFQIELALAHNLPMIFHVRDAFDDFWPIFDSYEGLRGVVHSFSATAKELEQALQRGLYIGLNGIMTFTKDTAQLDAAKAVPLDRLLLETDAPFLTPHPFRGRICEPRYVQVTAEFLSRLRGETTGQIALATTRNAQHLFGVR